MNIINFENHFLMNDQDRQLLSLALNRKIRPQELKKMLLENSTEPAQIPLRNFLVKETESELEQFQSYLQQQKLDCTCLGWKDYPKLLSEIFAPPKILVYQGELSILNNICLSVVGTRKASERGILQVTRLLKNLVSSQQQSKLTFISGLALGIDEAVHRQAIAVKAPTVAVLPSLLPQIYPSCNQQLAAEIVEKGGLLISEWSPESVIMKYKFVLRNRIIAGLAPVTVVAEAGSKSGALITARSAFKENRQVYVAFGDEIRGDFAGCQQLLESEQAAVLTEHFTLLKRDLGLSEASTDKEKRVSFPLTSPEYGIMEKIELGYNSSAEIFAELVNNDNFNLEVLKSALIKLELAGKIRRSQFGFLEITE